jgi:hypothetical protein
MSPQKGEEKFPLETEKMERGVTLIVSSKCKKYGSKRISTVQ